MNLVFTKSKWEMWDDPLRDFLRRAVQDGFEAVEVYLPALSESPAQIRKAIDDHGLGLVAQIITEGSTPDQHLESFRARIDFAAETEPMFINCHSGRDIFTFEDNVRIINAGNQRAASFGLKLTHETHRGRPTYNAIDTARYLEAIPEMLINADFSHWFCVHESDLLDQPHNVDAAITRAHHIHARVGFGEGPQVPDPLAPEWHGTTARFVALWQKIIDVRADRGDPWLTITPEFGPPPYMPCEPHTTRPLADAWTVNVAFMKHLREVLTVP